MTTTERNTSDHIKNVTSDNFRSLVLEAKSPVAVEFMSYGCAHCRVMEPILQEIAGMTPAEEKIYRVNVAVQQDLAEQYVIRGTPTLVMFLHGAEIGREEGPAPSVPGILSFLNDPSEQ